MIPANPDNNKPFIFRIADALGITHLVVAVQHSHLMSEIEGLVSALAGKSDTNHTHKLLLYNPSSSPDGFAGFTASGYGNFTIGVQESKSISLMFGAYTKANITNANVDNLARALQNPDTTPTADSDKLVTSGGVAEAIKDAKKVLFVTNVPFDLSTLDKGVLYTALITNTLGEIKSIGEMLDQTNLPVAERNIFWNVATSGIEVGNDDEFGVRLVRTNNGVYAFYDGMFVY